MHTSAAGNVPRVERYSGCYRGPSPFSTLPSTLPPTHKIRGQKAHGVALVAHGEARLVQPLAHLRNVRQVGDGGGLERTGSHGGGEHLVKK